MGEHSKMIKDRQIKDIKDLNSFDKIWTVKARVSAKSQIRKWSNAKGEGKLFTFDIYDATGEIRVTAFNIQVDKFFNKIEVNKVYLISRCQVKLVNSQYARMKHDCELTLKYDSVIDICDELTIIPNFTYDFTQISDITAKEVGTFVNIIAICKEATDVINLVSRAGKDLTKREVTLVDQSGASIIWTLWGEEAQKFKSSEQPVVLLKGARVGEFAGGKTLGASSMKLNPDIPESHNLLEWFKTGGHQKNVKSLSCTNGTFFTEWAFVNDINPSGQFKPKPPGFYRIKASIKKINPDYYEACINTGCYKKVSERNGIYKCSKCNHESTEFKYSVLINMCIDDWTSECWATGFSEVSEKLFKKNSNEIIEMMRNNSINTIIKDLKYQQKVFTVRSSMETYENKKKYKITIQSISEINYQEYNERLISNIEHLTNFKIDKTESMDITTDSQNEPMEISKENVSMDITKDSESMDYYKNEFFET